AYYFRRKFTVSSPADITSGLLRVMHDDGAIAWLNGTEIYRYGMPAGAVDYLTFANWTASGTDEYKFFEGTFDPGLLTAGTNLLAVEVHQVNANSSDISFAAELNLGTTLHGPAVTAHPQSLTNTAGSPVTLTATAAGENPLAYQWWFNGSPLAGKTTPSLAFAGVQVTNGGTYFVVVTNLYGTAQSLPAKLTVAVADSDGDGLPDAWELANGTNPNLPDANEDPDHDGHSNWQEYLAGTSPTNAASALRLEAFPQAGGIALRFNAISNRPYSLFSTDSLGVPAWINQTNIAAAASNRMIWLTNMGGAARFYRLVIPQVP
ncbi:MAG: immunoglobulin domain-containing protein, partial [Verrucomicrobia bacterium]|nr:immunoglobulin domain-containing protein [Verrucomicrobiota bacterium]